MKIVHRARGVHGEFLVLDEGPRRHLRFGDLEGIDQTIIERRRPGLLPTRYLQVASVGALLPTRLDRVLLIGLGGGGYARFLQRVFPGVGIDVVEIDPIVIRLATEYFGFRTGRGIHLVEGDGADFVEEAADGVVGVYDHILLDAYHGEKIPSPLGRQAFFRRVASLLAPGGVVVANIGLAERWAEDRIIRRFAQSLGGECLELPVPDEDNRIVLGSAGKPLRASQLTRRLRTVDDRGALPFAVLPLVRSSRAWSVG